MAIQYGVQTQNRFFLDVDEESDPFERVEREEALVNALKEKSTKPTIKKSQPGVKPVAAKPKPKPKSSVVNITYDSVVDSTVRPVNGEVKKKPAPKEQEVKPGKDSQNKPRERVTKFAGEKRTFKDKENVKINVEENRVDDQSRRGFREQNNDETREVGGTGFGGGGFGGAGFNRGGGRVFNRGGNRGGRGRGRGGFGDFGQKSGRDNRGDDRMERHSGSNKTGIKSVDKRDGHGKHNWGTEADDLKAEEDLINEERERTDGELVAQPDDEDVVKEKVVDEEVKEKDAKPVVVEPEPEPTMTMDEYKKKLAEERQKVQSEFNIRKPGEGESTKINKEFIVLKKKKEETEEMPQEEESDHHKAPKDNMVKDLFRFNYEETRRNVGGSSQRGTNRGGGGYRGRGTGGGGGRGRNDGRVNRNMKVDETKFDLTNDESFPTLS